MALVDGENKIESGQFLIGSDSSRLLAPARDFDASCSHRQLAKVLSGQTCYQDPDQQMFLTSGNRLQPISSKFHKYLSILIIMSYTEIDP